MPRVRLLLPLAASLSGCTAPALKNFTSYDPVDSSTGESEGSSSTGESASSSTSIMTTVSGSGSGSGSTTDGPDDTSTTTTVASTTSTASTTGSEPVCGDGVVAGDEECDDGNDDDLDRCADDCSINRWAFASAATDHNGDLGGVAWAHSRCQQYALQSGRADDTWKHFIAWISDADHDVRDRLKGGKGRYLRTDGVVVVESVEDFYSGMLAAPINVDEHGQPAPGGVLTGTMPDGTAAPGTHCENWTSGSALDFSAYTGSTGVTHAGWTMGQNPDTNPTGCAGQVWRLYCIESAQEG